MSSTPLKFLNEPVFIILTLALTVIGLGRTLNPFNQLMFNGGHDETQAARIGEFTTNLTGGKIPPRMAPKWDFGWGYPVFNFYAPTAYWIGSLIHLLVPDLTITLKLTYLLSLIVGTGFAFIYLRRHFKIEAALLGATLYTSSIYLAVDIFVRNNLAETWLIGLMPLSLWVLEINAYTTKKWVPMLAAGVLAVTLATHNILAPIWYLILIIYALLLLPHKVKNLLTMLIAVGLSASFWLPVVTEAQLTYVNTVAKQTDYRIHFLCPFQIWQSTWGYGGSNPGCSADGMSFMVGKPQLIFAILGGLIMLGLVIRPNKRRRSPAFGIFFLLLSFGSLWLTTEASRWWWDIFNQVMGLVQFPWRFLTFSLIGLAYLSAYGWNRVQIPFKKMATAILVLAIMAVDGKYFTRPSESATRYLNDYASTTHQLTETAYKIPEYLPKTANLAIWKSFDAETNGSQKLPPEAYGKQSFDQNLNVSNPGLITLNILYFPYWQIKVNQREIIPQSFDPFGRPQLAITVPSQIEVTYRQTGPEKVGNGLTVLTGLGLVSYLLFPAANKVKKTRRAVG